MDEALNKTSFNRWLSARLYKKILKNISYLKKSLNARNTVELEKEKVVFLVVFIYFHL